MWIIGRKAAFSSDQIRLPKENISFMVVDYSR